MVGVVDCSRVRVRVRPGKHDHRRFGGFQHERLAGGDLELIEAWAGLWYAV